MGRPWSPTATATKTTVQDVAVVQVTWWGSVEETVLAGSAGARTSARAPENRSGHQRRAGRDVSAPFLVPRPDDAAIEHLEDLGGENADVQARP